MNREQIQEKAAAHAAKIFPATPERDYYTERGIASGSYIVGYCDAALDLKDRDEREKEMREAVGGLHLDLSWLTNGAGTHVTVDTRKLIAVVKAASNL